MNSTTTPWAPVDVHAHIKHITGTVKMVLTEDYRDEVYDEAAAKMFPPKRVDGVEQEHTLSDEDERAVSAKIREDIDAFKEGLDAALRDAPAEEESFIDARGGLWEALEMIADPTSASGLTFQVRPAPLPKTTWGVFALFPRGDDSVAVYVFPTAELDQHGKPATHARILLSRHEQTFSFKRLTPAAFRSEIVGETVKGYYEYYGEGGHLSDDGEEGEAPSAASSASLSSS